MLHTKKLRDLMESVNISSFKSLSQSAGVSEWQVLQLRRGNLEKMRLDILLKLSQVLQISLNELVTIFSVNNHQLSNTNEIIDLQKEYDRILQVLENQRGLLQQEFQQSTLQILESLLLQWPTAAQKARENPDLAAVKIVPLVDNCLQKLLHSWGVDAIASVGAKIPYDPQLHQLIQGTAQPGEIVTVTHIGYLQGDKLLHRAKVTSKC